MEQHRLKLDENDQELIPSRITVKKNGKEIAAIDREKFSLAKYLCGERGLSTMQKNKDSNKSKKVEDNGIVVQIINEKIHEISVSKLNYLFKDKLIYLFAPIESIKEISNLKWGTSLGYVERGDAYPLVELRRYIKRFLHNNNVDFSSPKNFEEIFNRTEYQDIKRDSEKFKYILQCFEKIPNLFIFPTHDRAATFFKIEKIKNLDFDGFLISTMREEREIIGICINSKITSYGRRIVTIMSLYFSHFNCPRDGVIVFNVEESVERKALFLKIGDLLIGQNKKHELLDIGTQEELDKQAKGFGVSYSFLNWYLFYTDNRKKFYKLKRDPIHNNRNINSSKGGGKAETAIKHFFRDKTIRSVSRSKLAQLMFQNRPTKEARSMLIRYKI